MLQICNVTGFLGRSQAHCNIHPYKSDIFKVYDSYTMYTTATQSLSIYISGAQIITIGAANTASYYSYPIFPL